MNSMTQEEIKSYCEKKSKAHTEQFMKIAKGMGATKEELCKTSFELGMMAGMELQEIISMHTKHK